MGAGASVVVAGEVTNEHAEKLKEALVSLSDDGRTEVASALQFDGDIKCATTDELKEALTKLSEADRKTIADVVQAQSSGIPAYVTAFSAELGLLIDNQAEASDARKLNSFLSPFKWPNDFSIAMEPPFILDLRTKARELMDAYRSTMPADVDTRRTQRILDSNTETHKDLLEQQKKEVDYTREFLLNFITERDVDGNGVLSLEEATTICKALFKIEEVPAEHPLLAASVGKPLSTMANILTSNATAVVETAKSVEAAKQALSEAQEKHSKACVESSLAHYPDLLAKTKEVKAEFDSLTGEQFAKAAAEVAEQKKNWDDISNMVCAQTVITTTTTWTRIEDGVIVETKTEDDGLQQANSVVETTVVVESSASLTTGVADGKEEEEAEGDDELQQVVSVVET